MGIHVLSDADIGSERIAKQMTAAARGKKALLVCANNSVKELRQQSLADCFVVKGSGQNMFTHGELAAEIKKRVRRAGHYLSSTDCRYLFLKLIEERYSDDPQKLQIYKDIRHQLFELFNFLEFSEADVAEEVLLKIEQDFRWGIFQI